MADELVEAIQEAVTIRPGDTLVLRVKYDFSVDAFEELRARLRERIPPEIEILVIAGAVEQVIRVESYGFRARVLEAIKELKRRGEL